MQQPHFASTFRITWGQAQRPPLCPPRMAFGPPRAPHPGRPCRGNHGGRGGDGAERTPPLPPTPLQAGGGGEGGNGEGASRGRRKSGLEEGWGLCREGGAGLGSRAGRGGFPEPFRCGAQGPDVQRGGEGWWGRLGRDAAAAPAPSRASGVGGGSRPGRGEGGGRLSESQAPPRYSRGEGPLRPSSALSPLLPSPGSLPNPPSPRHHHVPTPRPLRLGPSSAAWVPPPSRISALTAERWGGG